MHESRLGEIITKLECLCSSTRNNQCQKADKTDDGHGTSEATRIYTGVLVCHCIVGVVAIMGFSYKLREQTADDRALLAVLQRKVSNPLSPRWIHDDRIHILWDASASSVVLFIRLWLQVCASDCI